MTDQSNGAPATNGAADGPPPLAPAIRVRPTPSASKGRSRKSLFTWM